MNKLTDAEQVAARDPAGREHGCLLHRRTYVGVRHPRQRGPQPHDGLFGDVLGAGQRAGQKVDHLHAGRVDPAVA